MTNAKMRLASGVSCTHRHLFRSGFELVYDQSVRSRLTGSLGRQMEFLEFDSSFVSRSDQLTNEPIRSKNSIYYRIELAKI